MQSWQAFPDEIVVTRPRVVMRAACPAMTSWIPSGDATQCSGAANRSGPGVPKLDRRHPRRGPTGIWPAQRAQSAAHLRCLSNDSVLTRPAQPRPALAG
jgi:hypothetical protein